jgi:hypothetical protein
LTKRHFLEGEPKGEMDTSALALAAGIIAIVLSGLHCFYRRGPHGSQTWELVYEPSPKGKDVVTSPAP